MCMCIVSGTGSRAAGWARSQYEIHDTRVSHTPSSSTHTTRLSSSPALVCNCYQIFTRKHSMWASPRPKHSFLHKSSPPCCVLRCTCPGRIIRCWHVAGQTRQYTAKLISAILLGDSSLWTDQLYSLQSTCMIYCWSIQLLAAQESFEYLFALHTQHCPWLSAELSLNGIWVPQLYMPTILHERRWHYLISRNVVSMWIILKTNIRTYSIHISVMNIITSIGRLCILIAWTVNCSIYLLLNTLAIFWHHIALEKTAFFFH